jgi:NitT/TauT family transport system substrate-binding protein
VRLNGHRCGFFVAVVVAALAVVPTVALSAPRARVARLDRVTIGYSAWPGWFPLAVAQKRGIFEKDGLDVSLKYFADYVSSLDAMSAGKLDANAQTLNDTMAAVAGGSDQAVIVVNDNSAGNDAIVCDESITSVADMRGRTIAAENGLVDHFLLLQGLASAGLTQDDIDFRDVLPADAAASFADGQFDCVAVSAPLIEEALGRPGSHVLFNSRDFPGAIPDDIVVSANMVAREPGVAQKIVNAWYDTLSYLEGHREKSRNIMAATAKLTKRQYEDLALGTRIFTLDDALRAFQPGHTVVSIQYTAGLINPFMVKSGLTKKEAPLDHLFAPQFTQAYAVKHQGGTNATSATSAPAA